MSMTNEQIQAIKAAAESCGKQEPLSLVVYHGKMCLRNKGGIVFTVLRDICFPEYSAENENYARLAEACTPDSILSLLAERDADKELIAELDSALEREREKSRRMAALLAEQDARLVEYAHVASEYARRIAELGAQRMSVTLPSINPEMFNDDVMFGYRTAQKEAVEFCAAAGIKLEIMRE